MWLLKSINGGLVEICGYKKVLNLPLPVPSNYCSTHNTNLRKGATFGQERTVAIGCYRPKAAARPGEQSAKSGHQVLTNAGLIDFMQLATKLGTSPP